ncbi:MAG: large subunit ribosomal protein L18 [Acidimicrobiales bacterium]|jgi:large subunit ribosomal protein L18
MKKTIHKKETRTRRHARIRSRVIGSATTPRLAVFRSNRYIYAQLINDETNATLASADSRKVGKGTLSERAVEVGTTLGQAAKKAGIESAVFDRGGFKYQGAVAALATGAREAGLKF